MYKTSEAKVGWAEVVGAVADLQLCSGHQSCKCPISHTEVWASRLNRRVRKAQGRWVSHQACFGDIPLWLGSAQTQTLLFLSRSSAALNSHHTTNTSMAWSSHSPPSLILQWSRLALLCGGLRLAFADAASRSPTIYWLAEVIGTPRTSEGKWIVLNGRILWSYETFHDLMKSAMTP